MLQLKQKSINALTPLEKERIEEKRMEAEKMKDITLLLENLFKREEATVKMILDNLYDVGSKNLINQKFSSRPVNRLMKMIATTSKPIFRIIAVRWFQSKCPQLIADWLQSKVDF
jgi:flagellin-specific chaperone FliS